MSGTKQKLNFYLSQVKYPLLEPLNSKLLFARTVFLFWPLHPLPRGLRNLVRIGKIANVFLLFRKMIPRTNYLATYHWIYFDLRSFLRGSTLIFFAKSWFRVSQYFWCFGGPRPFGADMVPRPNMGTKNKNAKKSQKNMIVGALPKGLNPLSFMVLVFLKSRIKMPELIWAITRCGKLRTRA